MTVVFGQIESLRRLKNTLVENGITRFNSIGDINRFKSNFDSERSQVPEVISVALDKEINALGIVVRSYIERSRNNFLYRVIYWPVSKIKACKKNYLQKHYEKVHSKRCASTYRKLDFTKRIIDEQYTLIAGAIGENDVVNELKKLSDNYYLINDFSIRFNPPIYNRKNRDRIFSIQIDHLLLSKSGVFILETKNWSRDSVNDLDLRSPVLQIIRASYALFVFLNSDSAICLENHHWGSKKIPIRNIIAMTNAKPKEEFQHVKVLSIAELNGYIQYFDDIFTSEECESLFRYLVDQTTRNT